MRTLWRLLGYLRPYAAWIAAGSLLLAAGGALMALVVSVVKPLVNQLLLGRPTANAAASPDVLQVLRDWLPSGVGNEWISERAFVAVPLLLVGVFFVRGGLLYAGQYLTIKAGASVIRDLRTELYEAVAYQSSAFFSSHPTGLLLSRILNDVQRLQKVATGVLADLVRVGAMVPFLLLVAVAHEWRMAVVALLALPLLGWPVMRLGRRLRRAATASQESMAEVANRLSESVGGMRVVQGFGMERFEVRRFREAVDRMLRADLRAGRAQALSPAIMELLGALVGAVLFYLAGRQIAAGQLDPGDFTVVLFCLGLLFTSFRRLSTLYAELQQALAAAVRVFDMLDREREIRDLPGAVPLPPFRERVEFRGVGFSYGDEPVLDGIDLTIHRGEMVALVGHSGSGKSTLANLLPRFYDPTSGQVRVDGQDIRGCTLRSLREQIALVTQETVLFDDTVRNNIAYGRADVAFQQVVDAARAAHADEFIARLPQGYDTLLGERGTRLSMGQRQRVAIARALLKAAPILILDEATSALDAESEDLVQRALERLTRGRTCLVIAHRLSTVRRADRIVVIERGRIGEQGTHDELLRRGGAYAAFCELQFADRLT